MTDTFTTDSTQSGQAPVRSRGGALRRLGRSIGYDALLVPVGVRTMADGVVGKPQQAAARWQRLAALLEPTGRTTALDQSQRPRWVLGLGVLSSLVGLVSWFLIGLAVMGVVRGPFWGFVEHGSVEPGTWGGPSRAGAWAVHAGVAVPSVVVLLLALKGISSLHVRLAGPLYGTPRGRWVLPATIVVAAGGVLFFWSWLQQL